MRKIELVPHDPSWHKQAQAEAQQIQAAFGPSLVSIHHIGSTAIPGILAKPTLDLLGVTLSLDEIDRLSPEMVSLGYEPRGENGIPGRRYFVKYAGEQHTHHIHIFQLGNPEIARHLNFRDHLIAHPEQARRYSELKAELDRIYSNDPDSYTEGKTSLVRELDRLAQKWKGVQMF